MKRLLLFSAILILSLTSCRDKYQPKNIYEEKFVNHYVETNFGRPSDFIEITHADYDTVTSDKALEMLDLYRDLFFLFDKETQSKLRQMENDARNDKGMVNITFKVRMK
jgi:PBP1b-binding outer membrane lipoprotein LpoB